MYDQFMSKHSWWSPKIGTHWSKKEWKKKKNTTETFYQTLRVHTLHMYVKQCMNIWKSCLNTYYFCHKGPTSKENNQMKQNPIKKIDKN